MTNEVETDASKVLANIQAVGNSLVTDAGKVKAWYKDYPFYAGCVIGGLAVWIVPILVRHIL